jgi:large subunit ribosomal protein L25
MTITTNELTAEPRDQLGTRNAQKIRKEGKLPVVLYGHKKGAVHLSLDAKLAITRIEAGEKIFAINTGGASPETALLKDVNYDYMGMRIIHADFERVNLDEVVTVNVPIRLIGDAVGLKTGGAMLIHTVNEIAVECKVADMQDSLEVDVSTLDVGGTFHSREVELPAGWKLQSDPDAVIAAIQIKKQEETAEEGEAEGGAEEPEVLADKDDSKKDESKE